MSVELSSFRWFLIHIVQINAQNMEHTKFCNVFLMQQYSFEL